MHHFSYKNGTLYAEDCALADLAGKVGTPFYVYSSATLTHHFDVLHQALADALPKQNPTICFAVKANASLAVLKTLAMRGAGADVVSGGELRLALKAGFPADRIIFSGVGKQKAELELALAEGIRQINVESYPELEALNAVAAQMGKQAPVAIRVNPDVVAGTHEKISTGSAEHKFGIAWVTAPDICRKAHAMSNIDFRGLAMHIGSQLTELDPFAKAFRKMHDLVGILQADGVPVKHLDLGGGLGIPYTREDKPPLPVEYAQMVKDTLGDLDCEIAVEPGRMIAGNAGMLVSRVVYVKETDTRTFVIVDAAMNDLVRPSMYSAHHDVYTISETATDEKMVDVDVVGPVCETGDTFARKMPLPEMQAGDLIAFGSAGAYGSVMSSTYNGRPLVPEVLVNGDKAAITRRRPTYEEMLQLESLPDWLSD